MLLGSVHGCVTLRYSKFYFFGHELPNSFPLFRVKKLFLQNPTYIKKILGNIDYIFANIVKRFTTPEYFLLYTRGSVGIFESPHIITINQQ